MKEFKRNLETGIVEIWEDGEKTGQITTMGDLIIRDELTMNNLDNNQYMSQSKRNEWTEQYISQFKRDEWTEQEKQEWERKYGLGVRPWESRLRDVQPLVQRWAEDKDPFGSVDQFAQAGHPDLRP